MSYRRDALIAAVIGAALLATLTLLDGREALVDADAAIVGVGVGLLVEAAFLADPDLAAVWNRRWVAPIAGLLLVVGAVGATELLGAVVLAAAVWGVATYFAVLALTVLGGLVSG